MMRLCTEYLSLSLHFIVMSNITLRDIAKALSLSVSTVSKALRDSYEISEATKARVLAYARENQYLPNRMAKSLKEGKSGSIGVVVCSIDNSFVSRMLDGIHGTCVAAGYDIIIMQSKESLVQEQACIKQLEARGVDGMLISPSAETVYTGLPSSEWCTGDDPLYLSYKKGGSEVSKVTFCKTFLLKHANQIFNVAIISQSRVDDGKNILDNLPFNVGAVGEIKK